MTAPPLYRHFPAIVAVLTLLLFLPALGNEFVNWDDERNFVLNPNYRGLGWTEIHWMWTSHLLGRYVPVTWMTIGLDYTIWGMNPLGYHLTSVLLHTVNAVLFYSSLSLFCGLPCGIARRRCKPGFQSERFLRRWCFPCIRFAAH